MSFEENYAARLARQKACGDCCRLESCQAHRFYSRWPGKALHSILRCERFEFTLERVKEKLKEI